MDTRETPKSFQSYWNYLSVVTATSNVSNKKKKDDGVKHPTDLGQDFIQSGMRLITQQSSDKYLSDLEHGGEGGSQTSMPS